MAGLLVSVRNAAEAIAALDGGANIVDVKEPARGSLGAADREQWDAVRAVCPPQIPLSLALGELLDHDLPAQRAGMPPVQFAKLGLAGCADCDDWQSRWRCLVEQLPTATRPVAVTYADWQRARAPHPGDVLHAASLLRCSAMLWDTHDKRSGNLLAHQSIDLLSEYVAAARERGMLIVLAGSLALQDLDDIALLAPDFVAVRGAVCAGSRTSPVDVRKVAQFANAVRTMARSRPLPEPRAEACAVADSTQQSASAEGTPATLEEIPPRA